MKRARDQDSDDADQPSAKRWQPSLCFPKVIDQIILDYVVDNPLDEFLDACIVGNLKMAEWLFDTFNLEKSDKKQATSRYEDKMPVAQDECCFLWSAKKLGIDPDGKNMLEKLINNKADCVKNIIVRILGNDQKEYEKLLKQIACSENCELFVWLIETIKVSTDNLFINGGTMGMIRVKSFDIFRYMCTHMRNQLETIRYLNTLRHLIVYTIYRLPVLNSPLKQILEFAAAEIKKQESFLLTVPAIPFTPTSVSICGEEKFVEFDPRIMIDLIKSVPLSVTAYDKHKGIISTYLSKIDLHLANELQTVIMNGFIETNNRRDNPRQPFVPRRAGD